MTLRASVQIVVDISVQFYCIAMLTIGLNTNIILKRQCVVCSSVRNIEVRHVLQNRYKGEYTEW